MQATLIGSTSVLFASVTAIFKCDLILNVQCACPSMVTVAKPLLRSGQDEKKEARLRDVAFQQDKVKGF